METHEAWQARIQQQKEAANEMEEATEESVFGEPIKAVPVTDSNDSPIRSLHLRYIGIHS